MPREQLQGAAGKARPGTSKVLPVAPHLAQVVQVFEGMRSQWRTASAGLGGFVFTGLDYAAIEPTLRLLGIKPRDNDLLFRNLRVMEMEALQAMNER